MASARRNPAGLNLLCLDGGGIRGIASLMVLQRLMEELNPNEPPKPCDHFDMIGGTSTGGLIAVMLGRLRMSVEEAYDEYMRLFPGIFTKVQHRSNWKGQLQGRYNSQAIESGVKEILRKRGMDEDELFKDTTPGMCPTFVCATRKAVSETAIFSSYPLIKRRGQRMLQKAKIWEVVRATSAASSFFDPIPIDGLEFVDGGTGANNPINQLWTEATDFFSTSADWKLEDNLGCIVSIGTGKPSFKKFKDKLFSGIIETLSSIATETEATWEMFHRQRIQLVKQHRAFRFNVDRGLENVELDEIQGIETIRSASELYLESEKVRGEMEKCGESLAMREIIVDLARTQPSYIDPFEEIKPAVQALCHSFGNTFVYDEWKTEAGKTGPAFLAYDISHIPYEAGLIGTALASYLREQDSTAGSVFYANVFCKDFQGTETPNPGSRWLPDVQRPDHQILQALGKNIIAQMMHRINSHHAIDPSSSQAKVLRHIYNNPDSTFRDYASAIDLLSPSIHEPTTIVFSVTRTDVNHNSSQVGFEIANCFFATGTLWAQDFRVLLVSSWRADDVRVIDDETEYQECLARLRFTEIDFYVERIPPSHPGTNTWVWTHHQTEQWMQAPSGILWIQGKPGSGKSVLCRTIVEKGRSTLLLDQDQQATSNAKLWLLAYRWIYSRRFEDTYTNHSYMLRSLLCQMLSYDQRTFNQIQNFWRRYRNSWITEDLEIRQLQEMIRLIVSGLEKMQLIIIDGFDEGQKTVAEGPYSHSSGREEILSFLVKLVAKHNFIKFLILSRPEPDITEILADDDRCFTIVLQQENKADIGRLIDAELISLETTLLKVSYTTRTTNTAELQQSSGSTRRAKSHLAINQSKRRGPGRHSGVQGNDSRDHYVARIREYIASKADGVFLWVSLIFKELNSLALDGIVSWHDIESELKKLPGDLMLLYQELISALMATSSPRKLIKARQAIQWVFIASAQEGNFALEHLRDALSIPTAEQCLGQSYDVDPFEHHRPQDATWTSFRRSIYLLCGPFIDVIRPKESDPENFNPQDVVQFIHTTAKDFLTSNDSGLLQFSPTQAERQVLEDIDCYLRLSFPVERTAYCPLPAAETGTWEENVNEMLWYLNGKPLAAFALQAFPQCRSVLPLWTRDLGRTALPGAVLEAFESPTETNDRTLLRVSVREQRSLLEQQRSLVQYGFQFFAGDISGTLTELATSALLGKFFCDACSEGLGTAVDNLIALVPRPRDLQRRSSPVFQILNGALIAAICRRRRDYVLALTKGNGHLFDAFGLSKRINEFLNDSPALRSLDKRCVALGSKPEPFVLSDMVLCFRDLALVHGNREITALLGGGNQSLSYDDDAEYQVRTASLSTGTGVEARVKDPLRMLRYSPDFEESSQESVDRAFDSVLSAYLLAVDHWRKALRIVRLVVSLRLDYWRRPNVQRARYHWRVLLTVIRMVVRLRLDVPSRAKYQWNVLLMVVRCTVRLGRPRRHRLARQLRIMKEQRVQGRWRRVLNVVHFTVAARLPNRSKHAEKRWFLLLTVIQCIVRLRSARYWQR